MAQVMTAADAASQLEVAIEAAEIASQHAPAGHPIFDAIDTGKSTLAWVQDAGRLWPPDAALTRTQATVQQVTDSIYAAMATIRNDPDQPLPSTIWPQVQALPWPYIAAGAGALLLVAMLFQKKGARR